MASPPEGSPEVLQAMESLHMRQPLPARKIKRLKSNMLWHGRMMTAALCSELEGEKLEKGIIAVYHRI
jgi:hypothetical protein